eukprot:Skav236745  [mRNA]  locus=scaffold2899:51552:58358:- [translate_table: standard]
MEGRHAQSMEAAEEKFRKAFDRVKRAAIEAPRDPRAESRIVSVKQLVMRARADFWFLLHQTSEEAVQYLRKSFDSLQEARGSLAANLSEEAQALDAAGGPGGAVETTAEGAPSSCDSLALPNLSESIDL